MTGADDLAGLVDNGDLSGRLDDGALSGLHDIVVPEPVSYLPQTVGWGVLLLVAIGIAVWLGFRAYRRRRRRRYRRLALAELEALRKRYLEGARTEVFAALPELVKRTALVAFPRREVASMIDEAWLEFLNRTYDGNGFTDGPGRWLPNLAYACRAGEPVPDDEEMGALVSLVRAWIRDHHQPEAVEAASAGGG